MWVNLATFCLLLQLTNMFEKESLGQEKIVTGLCICQRLDIKA